MTESGARRGEADGAGHRQIERSSVTGPVDLRDDRAWGPGKGHESLLAPPGVCVSLNSRKTADHPEIRPRREYPGMRGFDDRDGRPLRRGARHSDRELFEDVRRKSLPGVGRGQGEPRHGANP